VPPGPPRSPPAEVTKLRDAPPDGEAQHEMIAVCHD